MPHTFKRLFYVIIICLLLLSDATIGQNAVSGLSEVNNYLSTMQKDADLVNASWGFCLLDPANGKVLSEFDKERSLVPASGVKAITTLVALDVLGSDYRYTTKLEYDGEISNGVLKGNLYIRGSGDPTLGSNRMAGFNRFDTLFQKWVEVVSKQGIKKIEGSIIADASVFDNELVTGSWNWDDIGQYYGAGPSGLNIYENVYTLYYSSTKNTTRIDSVFPAMEGVTFDNRVTAGGSGNNAYIFGGPDSRQKYITGTIPSGVKAYTVEGAMPYPELFAAQEFKSRLEKQGIEITGDAKVKSDKTSGNRTVFYTHTSAALKDIVAQTNSKSINLYAESILKTIGKEKLSSGSREAGIKVIRNFWTSAGYSLRGFNMEDGSGLSRLNTMSTYQMASFMMYASKQKYFDIYLHSLAVAGESGTLKSIGNNSAASGKIFAKSGTMYKVRSYTGFVQGKSGKYYAFSVIVNNYTCSTAELKSKLEKLMIVMAGLE